jgi:hypothetical protein
MPRNARIDLSGAVQHLMIRGIERKRIFRDDLDRDDFSGRLGNLGIQLKRRATLGLCFPITFYVELNIIRVM